MKDENKIYKCAICGKAYDDVLSRTSCEMTCLKKQQEEEKAAAEAKKKGTYDNEQSCLS